MATADDKAIDDRIKRLVKEGISEYITEQNSTRTDGGNPPPAPPAPPAKKHDGLFGALFG